jgi:hypothetical protein
MSLLEPRSSQREELASALSLLAAVRDIIEAPVEAPAPPDWCSTRGWQDFLLRLGDDALRESERGGFAELLATRRDAPADLRELAAGVGRSTRLASLGTNERALPAHALRGVAARKRGQLAMLLGALPPLAAYAERIVDVGAGRGHLARLASELFDRRALALERNGALLRSGIEGRGARAMGMSGPRVERIEVDIGREPLALQRTDLAVGLHACGELGDWLVVAAGAARCDVALVSCCLQKTRASRRQPLSRAGRGLDVSRNALGLANLAARDDGVEASLSENLRAREARLALRYLLRARGLELGAGEEMRGVNRRRAHAGLEALAAHALALRGLPPATPAELRSRADAARRDHAIMRRLSLPRHLLARLIEVAIVRDRAAALEECGQAIAVAQLFEHRLTPRNTVLFASADPRRLPPLLAD